MVENAEDWLEWANNIDLNLDVVGKSFPEVDAIKVDVAYPTGLMTLEVSKFLIREVCAMIWVSQESYYASIQHGTAFVRSIRNWVTNDKAIKWDSSPHRPPFWNLLINEWSFAKDAVNAGYYEAGQRCLVDSMMMLILRVLRCRLLPQAWNLHQLLISRLPFFAPCQCRCPRRTLRCGPWLRLDDFLREREIREGDPNNQHAYIRTDAAK